MIVVDLDGRFAVVRIVGPYWSQPLGSVELEVDCEQPHEPQRYSIVAAIFDC